MSCAVNKAFSRAFYKWGEVVARRPLSIVGITSVISLLLMTRLFMAASGKRPLETEVEAEKLWVPQDCQAMRDKDKYTAAFGETARRNYVYFTSSDDDSSVLTPAIFDEIAAFDDTVRTRLTASAYKSAQKMEDLELEDGSPVGLADLCASPPGCPDDSSPLNLLDKGSDGKPTTDGLSEAELLARVNAGGYNVGATFGGIEYADDGTTITSAKVAKLTYVLEGAERDSDRYDACMAWEDQLNFLVGDDWGSSPRVSEGSAEPGDAEWRGDEAAAYPYTQSATGVLLRETIFGDVMRLNIGIALILVYAILVLARAQPVRSRALLAFAGIASCGLAIGIAYGVCSSFLKLNGVINVLPFVLLGIGVDDMFVLVNALEATDVSMPAAERIAHAMSHAGVSITVTSITDVLAFALGSTSQLPALSTFCAFAAIGILADYLLQISFFAAWMALDARREAKSKPDLTPCLAPVPDADTSGCCCCLWGKVDILVAPPEGRLRSFIRRRYVPCLRPLWSKIAIVAFFLGYASLSAWGASRLEQARDGT